MMMKSLSASGSDTAFPVDTAYFQSLLRDAPQKNHLPVSAVSAMTRHAALLLEYNRVMNLTAITSFTLSIPVCFSTWFHFPTKVSLTLAPAQDFRDFHSVCVIHPSV